MSDNTTASKQNPTLWLCDPHVQSLQAHEFPVRAQCLAARATGAARGPRERIRKALCVERHF
jgi:hypothetical protein